MNLARAGGVTFVSVPQSAVKQFLNAGIAVQLVGVSSFLPRWAIKIASAHSTVRTRQVGKMETTFVARPLAHVDKSVLLLPLTSPPSFVIQSHFRSYFFAPSQVVGS